MARYSQRAKLRQIASHHRASRRAARRANTYPLWHDATPQRSAAADQALEFGRFQVLLRQRQLYADGALVELGTRAFDLLLVLLEADGLLVTKQELLRLVWPGIIVSEENLKVQVAALRKALGADRDFIHTEFGRGYRFTGLLRSMSTAEACHHSTRTNPVAGRPFFAGICRRALAHSPAQTDGQ